VRTLALVCLIPDASAFAAPPNFLFILADDLAWSDVACYGHPWHHTPNIDSLARDGMKFTRGYAPAPICSASRAAILTGKTTARLNFEFVTKNEPGFQKIEGQTPLKAPPFTLNLPLAEQTIPEHFNKLGYRTAFFGKWHLNAHHKRYLGWSPTHGPKAQGFQIAEEDFGGHPYSWGKRTPVPITAAGEFPEDSMIDRAAGFLKQSHDRPFFLMVSMFYVHTPVKTQCEWLLDKYDEKVPADSPNRDNRVRYGAFAETLDHYVGDLLQALDQAGLKNETLVVFTSDNGGHPEFTANAPLRGSKWNLYEGGIRVPFLVRWPEHIPAGTVCDTPVVGYDLLPTFVTIAGGETPAVDGIDISTLFENPDWNPDRELIWHFPYYHPERGYSKAIEQIGIDDFAVSKTHPHSAILRGNDKLLYFYEYEDERSELYRLSEDIGEQNNLRSSNPALASELEALLKQRLQDASARFPTRQ
jgi:uncharacterized sulfatase